MVNTCLQEETFRTSLFPTVYEEALSSLQQKTFVLGTSQKAIPRSSKIRGISCIFNTWWRDHRQTFNAESVESDSQKQTTIPPKGTLEPEDEPQHTNEWPQILLGADRQRQVFKLHRPHQFHPNKQTGSAGVVHYNTAFQFTATAFPS